jgi:cytochrome P450
VTDSGGLFGPGFFDDPYPHYAAEREREPVQQTAFGPWLLLRYDDVSRLVRHHDVSVAAENDMLDERYVQLTGRPRPDRARSMLGSDPPDHTRLRRLVQKAFTPRVIAELRPLVQRLVDDALDAVEPDGSMDVIADLAFPLPFTVISRMLGMPETDAAQLRDWSHTITRALDPILSDDELRAAIEAGERMDEFLLEVVAQKRTNPGEDLLTGLIAAEEEGDVLSDDELLAQVALLFVAGHETTVNLIGNGTLALLRNRAQLERLRTNPALDLNAVEELLRWDSPVQFTARTLVSDLPLQDGSLPAGASVMACLGSANRDPDHWGPDADALDLGRPKAGNHVSFGGGIHHCLGAALARLEGQVAIPTLVRRFPGLDLANGAEQPAWNGRLVLRGLDRLPVTLGR